MDNELTKRILSSIILIPLAFFLIIEGSILFNIFLLICFFITYYEWYRMSKNDLLKVVGFYYLIFSFYTIYKLVYFNEKNLYFFLVIIICIATDVGGFVFGKILKGAKLTRFSPKKTISGLVGGYLLAFLFSVFFLNSSFFFINKVDINITFLIFVFLVSSISQLGDIFISYFKRSSKIKDTGKIIPGHGGLLDRLDGMIFAFPFSYIVLSTKLFIIF